MEVLNEKKVSIIKRYPNETLIVLLLVAVSFLTGWIYRLDGKVDESQVKIEKYLNEDRKEAMELQAKTNEALNKNTLVLENFLNQHDIK